MKDSQLRKQPKKELIKYIKSLQLRLKDCHDCYDDDSDLDYSISSSGGPFDAELKEVYAPAIKEQLKNHFDLLDLFK